MLILFSEWLSVVCTWCRHDTCRTLGTLLSANRGCDSEYCLLSFGVVNCNLRHLIFTKAIFLNISDIAEIIIMHISRYHSQAEHLCSDAVHYVQ